MLAVSDDRATRWDKRRLNRQDLKGSYNHNEYGDEDSDTDDIQRFVHDFDELNAPLEVMCMYVCVFTYIYIYYIYTHIRMYTHTYVHTYIHTYIHMYTYIHTYIHTYMHI
jgi:hypothetical protein